MSYAKAAAIAREAGAAAGVDQVRGGRRFRRREVRCWLRRRRTGQLRTRPLDLGGLSSTINPEVRCPTSGGSLHSVAFDPPGDSTTPDQTTDRTLGFHVDCGLSYVVTNGAIRPCSFSQQRCGRDGGDVQALALRVIPAGPGRLAGCGDPATRPASPPPQCLDAPDTGANSGSSGRGSGNPESDEIKPFGGGKPVPTSITSFENVVRNGEGPSLTLSYAVMDVTPPMV